MLSSQFIIFWIECDNMIQVIQGLAALVFLIWFILDIMLLNVGLNDNSIVCILFDSCFPWNVV